MTNLFHLLKERIEAHGPLSLHDYMDMALSHPEYGYYQQAEPFGSSGDFVTAPEVSQMFGELIGLWCVDCWTKMGAPARLHLMELGPGNGTLMLDALRSAALAPEFLKAVQIHLVESSDRLTKIQRKKLAAYSVTWHTQLPVFDDAPVLVIANEFFDALPIRQFTNVKGSWYEKCVDLKNGKLAFSNAKEAANAVQLNLPTAESSPEGSIIETSPLAQELTKQIGFQISNTGGAALVIDYGYLEAQTGDSFQAVRHHSYADPLEKPGEVDLTAHVNFATLTKIAEETGCISLPASSQGRFLERLGIEARALLLSKNATEAQKEKIAQDLKRLTSDKEMGTIFKALSYYSGMQSPPAGFGE